MLETLVRFGAPERILLDGKPHLGTDNLVRLLKNFRARLIEASGARATAASVDASSEVASSIAAKSIAVP